MRPVSADLREDTPNITIYYYYIGSSRKTYIFICFMFILCQNVKNTIKTPNYSVFFEIYWNFLKYNVFLSFSKITLKRRKRHISSLYKFFLRNSFKIAVLNEFMSISRKFDNLTFLDLFQQIWGKTHRISPFIIIIYGVHGKQLYSLVSRLFHSKTLKTLKAPNYSVFYEIYWNFFKI